MVAGWIVAGVVVLFWGLIAGGFLAVGPESEAATVFGSGLTAGVITLVTIALSINQFILSRVFASPDELADRLEGTHDLRRTVATRAGESSTPNDPAAFISLIARTIRERAMALERFLGSSTWDPPPEVSSAVQDVVAYGENIDDNISPHAHIVEVIEVVLGPAYAQNLTAARHLRNVHRSSLSEEARGEFEAIIDLLESLAISRQFFKVVSLQQDFARLSRRVVYAGLAALVASVSLTLIYRTGATTISQPFLTPVVSIGIGIIFLPLAVFVAYILRAATIAERTVSVGPFTPPKSDR